jgi:REP element-mobilizing transposase RayT
MPDHLHALLAFPPDKQMSKVIGAWKAFQSKRHGLRWQGNYFDHRIRNEAEAEEKAAYIRQNPVVKGLCVREEDWPWVYDGNR